MMSRRVASRRAMRSAASRHTRDDRDRVTLAVVDRGGTPAPSPIGFRSAPAAPDSAPRLQERGHRLTGSRPHACRSSPPASVPTIARSLAREHGAIEIADLDPNDSVALGQGALTVRRPRQRGRRPGPSGGKVVGPQLAVDEELDERRVAIDGFRQGSHWPGGPTPLPTFALAVTPTSTSTTPKTGVRGASAGADRHL